MAEVLGQGSGSRCHEAPPLVVRGGEPELGVQRAVVAAGRPAGRCGQDRAGPAGEDVVDGEQAPQSGSLTPPGAGTSASKLLHHDSYPEG